MFKQVIHIILYAFVLLVFFLSGFVTGDSCTPRTNHRIESLKDSLLVNQERLKYKEKEFNTLDSIYNVTLVMLNKTQKSISKLKSEYNVKKDYVANLSNDSSFIFLSEWLSKADSTGQ